MYITSVKSGQLLLNVRFSCNICNISTDEITLVLAAAFCAGCFWCRIPLKKNFLSVLSGKNAAVRDPLHYPWPQPRQNSAKAELAHPSCGCTTVSIIPVVLFSPRPLCPPDVLGDWDMKTTSECVAKKTGVAERHYLSWCKCFWPVLVSNHLDKNNYFKEKILYIKKNKIKLREN